MLLFKADVPKYYVFGLIKIQTILFYAVDISFIFFVQQKLHADVTVGFQFILVTRLPAKQFRPRSRANFKFGWRVH